MYSSRTLALTQALTLSYDRTTFRGNTYEGFFMDHGRSGPGMLFRGNVKDVYDPKSGSATKKSNRVYEGNWRAGELRAGSMVRK